MGFIKSKLPKTKNELLVILFAVSSASLITANLCTIKNIDFFGMTLALGILTIVIDYVVSDLCVEVYGFRTSLKMRRWAMICNVASVLLLNACVSLPPDPQFEIQGEFATIFSMAPLMVLASMVAYMCGTWVNDKVMSVMKIRDGETSLFKRCILSTVFGDVVDTAVFTAIAYGASYTFMSNIENIVLTYLFKVLAEVVIFNVFTKRIIGWAKSLS